MKLPVSKCEKIVKPKSAFHKASFRWVKRGKNFLLIGCPKKLDRGGRLITTKWSASARKGTQCRVASSGARAGTRVHAIVQKPVGGRCRVGRRMGR